MGPSSLNVFVLQRRVGTGRLRIGPRHSRRGNSRVTLFAAAVRRSTAGWPPSGTVPTKVDFWRPRSRKSGSRIRAAVSNHTVRLPSSAKPPAAKEDLVRALLAEAQNHVLRASRRITSARCRFQTSDVCNRTGGKTTTCNGRHP